MATALLVGCATQNTRVADQASGSGQHVVSVEDLPDTALDAEDRDLIDHYARLYLARTHREWNINTLVSKVQQGQFFDLGPANPLSGSAVPVGGAEALKMFWVVSFKMAKDPANYSGNDTLFSGAGAVFIDKTNMRVVKDMIRAP